MNTAQYDELIETLKSRFANNMSRHEGIAWSAVQNKLTKKIKKLQPLYAMETTGGEPDVISFTN